MLKLTGKGGYNKQNQQDNTDAPTAKLSIERR